MFDIRRARIAGMRNRVVCRDERGNIRFVPCGETAPRYDYFSARWLVTTGSNSCDGRAAEWKIVSLPILFGR
jgi:hypothetical protein